MILSNVELHKAIDQGRLIIDPEPEPRFKTVGRDDCPYDTHTVDLTLGAKISIPDHELPVTYDLAKRKGLAKHLSQNSRKVLLTEHDQPFVLKHGRFILAQTHERISLPILDEYENCLSARIEGKSSRARLGLLVHFTAPTVHPGFSGTLTLEMINLGPADISLTLGVPIAQLIVEEVIGRPVENPSQFQGQSAPEGVVSQN